MLLQCTINDRVHFHRTISYANTHTHTHTFIYAIGANLISSKIQQKRLKQAGTDQARDIKIGDTFK